MKQMLAVQPVVYTLIFHHFLIRACVGCSFAGVGEPEDVAHLISFRE
jgi:hypothetical protein